MHNHPENGHAGDEQEPQNVGGVPLRPQGHRDRVLGKVEEGEDKDLEVDDDDEDHHHPLS